MTTYLFIFALMTSALLTGAMRLYSLKFNIIDTPNTRSSHITPTPRGGGLAIVITLLCLLVASSIFELLSWPATIALAIPGSIIAIIGFIDDHRPLTPRLRILVHFGAAALALILLPAIPSIELGQNTFPIPPIAYPLLAIGLVWLLNLYNFMDGIDGIAGAEASSVLIAAAVILYLHNETQWGAILLCFSAPALGFLVWNWAPAKIFMGDVGSAFLGIILGTLALLTSSDTPLNLWSWLILLAVFIADSTWTLLARISSGQAWHQPHRSHAYQRLARKTRSHACVSLGTTLINILYLAPLAYTASQSPEHAWQLTLLAYLPLISLCWWQQAGKAEQVTDITPNANSSSSNEH